MVKIVVGSNNPVKINAVRDAFSHYFSDVEVESFPVESGVHDQPLGEDTFKGAENRAKRIYQAFKDGKINADFFVGIEGGAGKVYGKVLSFAVACIMNKDGEFSFGVSPAHELPQAIASRIMDGEELGVVMGEITGESDIKYNQGTVGKLTRGVISRKSFCEAATIMALVPFLNKELFTQS